MIQSNELITLIVGLGALGFVLACKGGLDRLPRSGLLLNAFFLNVLAWFCTVVEGFFWGELLNLLEHAASTASAALLAYWCWQVSGSEGRSRP